MELFKAGKQTDSSGHTKEWTKADLDKIVSTFNDGGEDIPATLGHKIKDKPAMAWFKKVWRDGETLFGEMGDIVDEFGVMLKKKMFKNRSIALRSNLSLRHIAFLGAEAPAIKGLAGFAFKEEDNDFFTIDFAEHEDEFGSFHSIFAFKAIGRILRNLRDKMIEKDGVEKTDEVIENFDIDQIEEAGNQQPKPRTAFNESKTKTGSTGKTVKFTQTNPEDSEMNELETAKAKITELEKSNGEFSEEIKTLKESNTKLETEKATEIKAFADFKESEKKVQYSEYLDGLASEGKMLPANKEANLAMLMDLDGKESLDYSEGDETKKKTQVDIFKANLENTEPVIEFGEFTNKDKSPESNVDSKLSQLTKERMKEKGEDFSEASQHVLAENPTLILQHNVKSNLNS